MNYIKLFQDSFRILRTNKLVWIFGLISLSGSIIRPLRQLALGKDFLLCGYEILNMISLFTGFIGIAGVIYITHQTVLNKKPSIKKVWVLSRLRLFRILGLLLLILPVLLVVFVIGSIISHKTQASLISWLSMLITIFFSPLFLFGVCTVIIDNLMPHTAVWTTFLIIGNNFHRFMLISLVYYFTRWFIIGVVVVSIASRLFQFDVSIPSAFDLPAYQEMLNTPVIAVASWMVDLFLSSLDLIFLTLCYLKFTKEKSYPALSKRYVTL